MSSSDSKKRKQIIQFAASDPPFLAMAMNFGCERILLFLSALCLPAHVPWHRKGQITIKNHHEVMITRPVQSLAKHHHHHDDHAFMHLLPSEAENVLLHEDSLITRTPSPPVLGMGFVDRVSPYPPSPRLAIFLSPPDEIVLLLLLFCSFCCPL
jgi:hypothetical protein